MALSTGKIVEVIFDNAIETHEEQLQMLNIVNKYSPDSAKMQNAGNTIWRTVEQHSPLISGFNISGQATGIIEETYPSVLGDPSNDLWEVRADDMREQGFWERRGRQAGKKQASELNKQIAQMIADTGSLFYRSNDASGYDFISEAQALMNERQLPDDMRYFLLNDRSNQKFSQDLAARQTLQGRPEQVWATGQIGQNIAEFDVYTGSFLPTLLGGADPATTVTNTISEAPTGGNVNPTTHVVTNVDYREATIVVADSSSYNIGDRVTFTNGSTTVKALGLMDKTVTESAMTFVITAKPDGTSVVVYPKPIALDDAGLSVLEKAYANINTQILATATMDRLNIVSGERTNAFWAKDSIEVLSGEIPAELFSEFSGKTVINSQMSNGQNMYMIYDGDIEKLTFTCRLFTWYGITNANPSANGVCLSF